MSDNAELQNRLKERILLCQQECRAYEIWLATLTPANFFLVGIGGVLSLIAGLSIVTEAQLITPKAAGWLAVLGALMTGLHDRLKCDAHQLECRKIASQFAQLQTEYERLQIENDDKALREQLMSLEHKLASIRGGRSAQPSDKSVARAKRDIESRSGLPHGGDVRYAT